MYIQITNRCQSNCEHCCFSCTMEGKDMPFPTFRKAIDFCEKYGEKITIGGGEPTLHPQFEKFILHAIKCNPEPELPVWISTNGTNKYRSEIMIAIAIGGVLSVNFSFTQFHNINLVDPELYARLEKIESSKKHPNISVRYDQRLVMKKGRSETGKDDCACEDIFVGPTGNVHYCGCCSDSPKTLKSVSKIMELQAEFETECFCKLTEEQQSKVEEL